MKRFISIMAVVSAGAVATPAFAGSKHAQEPGAKTKKLYFLRGTWKSEETHKHGGKKMTSEGTDKVELGPGGFSVVSRYESKSPHGKYEGFGITAWDRHEKKYKSVWTDSMTGRLATAWGEWEGDELVFTGTKHKNGKTIESRYTYTDISDGSYTLVFEHKKDGEWVESMRIDLTRTQKRAQR